MRREMRFWLVLTAVGMLGFLNGCGGDKQESPKPDGPSGSGVQSSSGVPETADAAVMQVVRGLQQDNARAVWEFLPKSYQSDVNSLVSEFGTAVDAELWDHGFGLLNKLVKILQDKKEFILGSEQLSQAPVNPEQLSQNWETLLQLLTTIVDSDLSDVEKLKTFDGGDYLETTGGALLRQLAAASKLVPDDPYNSQFKQKLDKVVAKVVEIEGDIAVLELTDPDGIVAKVDFVRVDRKWIPAAMKADWPVQMEQMRASVKRMPQQLAAVKPQLMSSFKMIDGLLDQISAAQTQEQFTQAVAAAVLPVLMAAGPLMSQGDAPNSVEVDGSTSALPSVSVIVNKKLDDDAVDVLIGKLAQITDDADNALAIPQGRSDDSTSIGVAPVLNLQEFAKRIKFAKVISVDKAKATIVIELAD